MGRSRLLSVLTATVLSVGALSVPAAALDLDSEVSTDTVEETVGTVEETVSDDDPVEDAVNAVEETAAVVEETVGDAAEDPVGTVEDVVEDPEGNVRDLVDPVSEALPGSGDDETRPADDGDIEPADDPEASASPSTGPGTSTSPSFDRMLTAPEMDHGVTARPGTSRPQVAPPQVAQDATPTETVELAPEVAVQAAAPEPGPLGLPADAVPALLRALTAMLVAGAMLTWRTVQQQLAD